MKHSEMKALMVQANEEYEGSIRALAKSATRPFGFTKKTIETLISGHRDGVRNMLLTMQREKFIHVEAD